MFAPKAAQTKPTPPIARLMPKHPAERSSTSSPQRTSQPDLRNIPVFPPGKLTVGAVNDPLEREADNAANAGGSNPLLAQGMSRAQLHTGRHAERAADALGAAAFTVGDDIFFGAGQYRPDTASGQHLIAHEAAHVGQQARFDKPMVQRQPNGVINMPPETITATLNPTEQDVKHLDRLQGQGVTPNTVQVAHDPADIQRNTPDPAAPLPFTNSGWDGATILTQLGQYDRMPGTDSDSLRCVQAVGMAARVPDGPEAVTAYIASLITQGMLTGQLTDRKRTAIDVLKHVTGRIQNKRATYGDLSWAQEAMHDLFYDDVSGTPSGDIKTQVAPDLDLTKNLQSMDVWCDTPQQVMAQASQLKRGEQLLVESWQVMLNIAFDQLEDQNIQVPEGGSQVVNINGHPVTIKRIPSGQRPPHTALDLNRDRQMGHQLLIIKDTASDAVRLYEPETTASGRHFDGLAADGSNLTGYFADQPNFGIYNYIEIIGKLTPALAAATAKP